MSIHTSLAYIMYALGPVLASNQVIVGQRWPPPRWFLANNPPPGEQFVVNNGIQVVSNGDSVVTT